MNNIFKRITEVIKDAGFITFILCFIIGYISGTIIRHYSYNSGYNKGYNAGIDYTLDTVNTMLKKQVESQNKFVTEVTLETPKDTLRYILSNKTLEK